jgi:hypothetical protein
MWPGTKTPAGAETQVQEVMWPGRKVSKNNNTIPSAVTWQHLYMSVTEPYTSSLLQ